MATVPVPDLLVQGLLRAALYHCVADENNSKLQNLETQIRGLSPALDVITERATDVQASIRDVVQQARASSLLECRESILGDISTCPSTTQAAIVTVSMQIQCLLKQTSIDDIVISVLLSRKDDDESKESYLATERYSFTRDDPESRITKEIVSMETDLGLFSKLEHSTEDKLTVNVDAWATREQDVNEIVLTTGSLYYFGKVLTAVTADTRGRVLELPGGDSGFYIPADGSSRLQSNSALVRVWHGWVSPRSIQSTVQMISRVLEGEEGAFEVLSDAVDIVHERHQRKYVYLVGLSGEGKSTLGNRLTGTQRFDVSHAGTGSFEIRTQPVQESGVLFSNDEKSVVIDTPGLNDGMGRDDLFERRFFQYLNCVQSVSAILVVSKDGSRIPSALTDLLQVYRKAFGDAWMDCVCILVGVNQNKISAGARNTKKKLFSRRIEEIFGTALPHSRIFFYDARDSDPQQETERLSSWISASPAILTGTGSTVSRGLMQLKQGHKILETATRIERLRDETHGIATALMRNLQFERKLRFNVDESTCVVKSISFAPGFGNDLTDNYDMYAQEWKKNMSFETVGPKAAAVLTSVGSAMAAYSDKDRIYAFLQRVIVARLVLAKIESTKEKSGGYMPKIVHKIAVLDVDEHLQGEKTGLELLSSLKSITRDRFLLEQLTTSLEDEV